MLTFAWDNDRLPKNVLDWQEKCKGIGRGLEDHREVLDLVHEDVKGLSQKGNKGRERHFASKTYGRWG